MLKMYHRKEHHGGTSKYWEENWKGTSFEESVRFCEVDPLRSFFERHLKSGDLMLEGGCGVGQYVAFYADRGVKAVGFDFERVALSKLHEHRPALPLCAGDVAHLPFRDGSFDCYYSGGIVEHFEDGADAALREARRVLRPKGVLLITVPYFSPFRQLLSLKSNGNTKRVSSPQVDKDAEPGGVTFFQYAYTADEFKSQLTGAGFHVVATRRFSILWGLYEVPLLRRFVESWMQKRGSRVDGAGIDVTRKSEGVHEVAENVKPSLLKRLVVGEDLTLPVLGWLVRMLGWGCANMILYVCDRESC